MNRRELLSGGLALAAAGTLQAEETSRPTGMIPCMNQITNIDSGFEKQCAGYAAAGMHAIEPWPGRLRQQKLSMHEARAILDRAGLQAVSACSLGGLLWQGEGTLTSQKLDALRQELEWCQALGASRYVVFTAIGAFSPLPAAHPLRDEDYSVAAGRVHQIAELAQPYGVRIALEFIAKAKFIGSLTTAMTVLRQAGHPNAGICLDAFHFFAGISKTEDLDQLRPNEVAQVHFHDAPASPARERLTDRDRLPAGEGVIPLAKIVAALQRIGYQGPLSTELFGAGFQKADPEATARRCLAGIRRFVA